MSDINATIKELTTRRAQVAQEIEVLDGAIAALLKISGGKTPAKPAKKAAPAATKPKVKAKRNMSAAARDRIREAQKRRWAAFHAAKAAKTAK